MYEEPKKPIKRRWLVAMSAAIASVTTLIVENAHLIGALTDLLRSLA